MTILEFHKLALAAAIDAGLKDPDITVSARVDKSANASYHCHCWLGTKFLEGTTSQNNPEAVIEQLKNMLIAHLKAYDKTPSDIEI